MGNEDLPRMSLMRRLQSQFRSYLLEMACFLLRLAMIPWAVREIYAQDKATIINYHDPSPEVFESHIRFYLRFYHIISIDSLITAISENRWSSLPPKPLVITFDDGHAGNARLFTIVRKYKIPIVLYVTSGIIDTNRRFWFRLQGLSSSELRFMKTVDDDARGRILLQAYSHSDTREYEGRAALNGQELRSFLEIGAILGSHTVFHPVLCKCNEKRLRSELKESKQMLEWDYGVAVQHFAYPDGSYNPRIAAMVKETAYSSARTIDPGWVTSSTDVYALPNFGITDNASVNKAIVQASGVWDMFRRAFRRLFNLN